MTWRNSVDYNSFSLGNLLLIDNSIMILRCFDAKTKVRISPGILL